jgi:hypothetical protein
MWGGVMSVNMTINRRIAQDALYQMPNLKRAAMEKALIGEFYSEETGTWQKIESWRKANGLEPEPASDEMQCKHLSLINLDKLESASNKILNIFLSNPKESYEIKSVGRLFKVIIKSKPEMKEGV